MRRDLMKSLIQTLKEICTSYPLSEKVLIVDHYRTGEQILNEFINTGHCVINIKIHTIQDIAIKFLSQKFIQIKFITPTIGSILMTSIIKTLKDKQKLHYFHLLETTPSLSMTMYKTIQEIRLSGYSSTHFPRDIFKMKDKASDLQKILYEYERILEKNSYWDETKAFLKVIEQVNIVEMDKCIFLFQPNLSFIGIEEQFVSMLLSKHSYILPIAPVYEITPPARFAFILEAHGKAQPSDFSYLLSNNHHLGNIDFELFASHTEEEEINEMLRRMMQKEIPFDTCACFYSQQEPYQMMMYQLSEKMKIPVTFGEGLPITVTNPGKMILEILQWFKQDFSAPSFLNLLQEGVFDFDAESPSILSITRMIRNSEIGTGKERYLQKLQVKIHELKEELNRDSEEHHFSIEKKIAEYTWLYQWFETLFQFIPSHYGGGKWKGYLDLLDFILEFAKIQSVYDKLSKDALVEQIQLLRSFATEPNSQKEMLSILEEYLLTIRIGASGPKSGSLHFTSFQQALFINRKNLYYIGFDNQRFPGKVKENPLLLDDERKALCANLPLHREKAKENIFHLLQALACSTGRLTISYPVFNQQENRLNTPSHFFLTCYRILINNSEANNEQLIGNLLIKSHFETDKINQKEWWQSLINYGNHSHISLEKLEGLKYFVKGYRAIEKRSTINFTEYEGKVNAGGYVLDPRKNRNIRLSSSRLEKLATCPYKYFLEDILQIAPAEPVNQNKWLDGKTRGILLHEIFEQFYKTILVTGDKPSYEKHIDMLITIAKEKIDYFKERIFPDCSISFEEEMNEIIESCHIFLKSEEEHTWGNVPAYFEYVFGLDGNPPAKIHLNNSESFFLSGKIDRVDKQEDMNYVIIDYKTGSAREYSLNKFFNGGRHLQHFLYAKALENQFNLYEGQVINSTYLFPTTKGLGERRVRLQDSTASENGLEITERLLDLLKAGYFPMTDDIKKDCRYCTFQHVCKRNSYSEEQYEEKMRHVKAINRWMGVRAYE